MKKIVLSLAKSSFVAVQLSMVLFTAVSCQESSAQIARYDPKPIQSPTNGKNKIQIAILLDTSSSMDGLIDQAKARLWNIVNTMTTLRYKGVAPQLEIALYEYGNDGLHAKEGFVRQVAAFTTDLDLLSEKLFSLRTNGGLEYCGTVINKSLNQLFWDGNPNSMKLIYIAGNERFDQGDIVYSNVVKSAVQKGVYVNTIHCGDYNTGINELWKSGADLGGGQYFNIDHQKSIRYVATPYDNELSILNQQLNATYYGYGLNGTQAKVQQATQDRNAASMDKAVYIERSVSKSKAQYLNTSWDLVDAYKNDKKFIEKVDKNTLSEEFKNLSTKELEQKIVALEQERKGIQSKINELGKKRSTFISEQSKQSNDGDDLGAAITQSILKLAKSKQYTQEQ